MFLQETAVRRDAMEVMNEKVYRFLNRKPEWTFTGGMYLNGLLALFRATGDADCKRAVLRFMEASVSADGTVLPAPTYSTAALAACGKALFFALDETGEERYKKALDEAAGRIKERPLPDSPAGLWAVAPFLAEYDTRFGGKQTYKALADQFRTVHQVLFEREKGLYRAENGSFSFREEGFMLLALADTAEKMDMQMYEHYRMLADIFLEAVRTPYQRETDLLLHLLPPDHPEARDLSGKAMIAAALLKGVRLQLLNEEKYLPLILPGQCNLSALYAAGFPCDPGPWMLLQAEMKEAERS